VPGLGISHTFLVSQDALRPALGALSRTVYAQRCGVAMSKEYLAPWERPEVRGLGYRAQSAGIVRTHCNSRRGQTGL